MVDWCSCKPPRSHGGDCDFLLPSTCAWMCACLLLWRICVCLFAPLSLSLCLCVSFSASLSSLICHFSRSLSLSLPSSLWIFLLDMWCAGGQLLCKMPAHDLQLRNQKFSSLTAYGFTKRAQVLLTERWAKEYPGVSFFSMHPGWVDTGCTFVLSSAFDTSLPPSSPLIHPPALCARTKRLICSCNDTPNLWCGRPLVRYS